MPNQADTARANGAKSQGPIIAEGEATSSRNATRHGLTSAVVVMPHESQEDYDQLEASLFHEFRPTGTLQSDLVREMAAARWRLRRIQEMESAV